MPNGITDGSIAGLDAVPIRQQLVRLGAAGATGRLGIRGVAGGWIHLQEGRIYCAERVGHPTLLVAMGEADLFSAEEWTVALRLPFGPKWGALVGGDPSRLAALVAFTRAFVLENVGAFLDQADDHVEAPAVFVPSVTHPFGPIERWSVEEILGELPEPVEEILGELPAPPPRPLVPTVDRAEFLELLEEVSPHIRRPGDGRICVAAPESPR